MSFLRQSLFNWLAIGWTVAIFVACSWPGTGLPNPSNSDKFYHVSVFLLFGVLWIGAGRKASWVIGAGIVYGLLIEVWQGVMPLGRSFDWYDELADAVGVLLGAGIALLAQRANWL